MATRSQRGARSSGDPLAHLDSDGPWPVYAIDGDERALIDEAVERIRKVALGSGMADFNEDIFNAKEAGAARITDASMTLPAFSPTRFVLVRDAHKLGADVDSLLGYLEDPSPSTVLLLLGEKFDARTKLYKTLKKNKWTLRFSKPREREMPAIIERRAQRLGVSVDRGAVRALVDALGADVGAATAALEKLALYVGPESGETIDARHVEELVSHAKEESIFALADAVGSRNPRVAVEILHAMLSGSRGHPLGLLGMIARHWRRLTDARSSLDGGADKGDLQAKFGLPPFVVDKLLTQARRQSRSDLISGLRAIAEADQDLKGGKLPGDRVMERLVLRLTGAMSA